VNLVTVFEVRS